MDVADILWLAFAIFAVCMVFTIFTTVQFLKYKKEIVLLKQTVSDQALALQEAQDVSQARSLFLGSLSHELRTPISGIMGATQLLKGSALNVRQHEYAAMIGKASTTLLEIVDDMLTFSRINAGRIDLEQVCFSPRELINDMLAMYNIKALERGLVLILDISNTVPNYVMGDRGKLNQALLNIIGNAIKFTDEGSITVSVMAENHTKNRYELKFCIQDTGIGIDNTQLENVYKPFMQTHVQQGHEDRGGTGLGLTICERLVKAMGGNISIDSVLGQGTSVCFTVYVQPIEEHSADWNDCHMQSSTIAGDTYAQKAVVLVIEDDEVNRLVCTRYLAISGHHPLTAANETQAIKLINSGHHKPDIILLDMNLSGKSGANLAQKIRSTSSSNLFNIPIIAISADVSGTAERQAIKAGADAFLPKPFSASRLNEIISDLMEQRSVRNIEKPRQENSYGFLDTAFLDQEIEDLSAEVVLELLNIFRSNASTLLHKMEQAYRRRDWESVGNYAHALQGSSSNLGMKELNRKSACLCQIVGDIDAVPASETSIHDSIEELEVCCNRSADLVRSYLLSKPHESIALTMDGYY